MQNRMIAVIRRMRHDMAVPELSQHPLDDAGHVDTGIGARAVLTPIGLDDWSDLRNLHAVSFERLIAGHLDEGELEAFKALVASFEYSEDLRQDALIVARIDGYLTGSCAWRPSDDAGLSARVTAIFVYPMFTRFGIGRRLLLETEAHALSAGFQICTARAPLNAAGFFERLGYATASFGSHMIDGGKGVPVAFMRKSLVAK